MKRIKEKIKDIRKGVSGVQPLNIFIFSKCGLTLLEVIIALSIFAIAGISCLQTCLLSTRHIQLVNEEKNLVLLSKIKIEEYKAGILNIETEKSGVFPAPFEEYEWEIELADITITDTDYGVTFTPYKLTVKTKSGEYSILTCLLKSGKAGEKE